LVGLKTGLSGPGSMTDKDKLLMAIMKDNDDDDYYDGDDMK